MSGDGVSGAEPGSPGAGPESGPESPGDADSLAVVRARYRRLIRVYPRAWRRDNGEALLGTCLDAAAARPGPGPTGREALDLVRHGLVWRLRLLAPSERTRQLAAVLGLMFGTATALTCFIAGEWGFGSAARGWRVDPGHVGPFATLGSVFYPIWGAAVVAVLLGRARWARGLLIATMAVGGLMHGSALGQMAIARYRGQAVAGINDGLFGLRLPPAGIVASLILLALVACLGSLKVRARERWLIAPGTLVLTVLMLIASSRPSERTGLTAIADPSYAFYRSSGFSELVDFQTMTLFPLLVLLAVLIRRWMPELLPASLILSLVATMPFARMTVAQVWLGQLGSVEYAFWGSSWVATLVEPFVWPLMLAPLAAAVWWRWRRGRPRPVDSVLEGAIS